MSKGEASQKKPVSISPAAVCTIKLEILITASRERVWKALVDETHIWWKKDFYTSPQAKSFRLEPRLGGRMYEDWGNETGVTWYTVIAIDPGNSLDLAGHISELYGGPATTMLHIELVGSGAKTILRLSDSIVGRVQDGCAETKEEGWMMLFGDGLKTHVES